MAAAADAAVWLIRDHECVVVTPLSVRRSARYVWSGRSISSACQSRCRPKTITIGGSAARPTKPSRSSGTFRRIRCEWSSPAFRSKTYSDNDGRGWWRRSSRCSNPPPRHPYLIQFASVAYQSRRISAAGYRATVTLQWARPTRSCETDPTTRRVAAPLSPVPTTMWSTPASSA